MTDPDPAGAAAQAVNAGARHAARRDREIDHDAESPHPDKFAVALRSFRPTRDVRAAPAGVVS